MSRNFLIEHDRHRKVPTRITVYNDLDPADECFCCLVDELNACLNAGKPVRMEYVAPSGASPETIKQTHSRYFIREYAVVQPTEIHYLASWREQQEWTPEDAVAEQSRAFTRALYP